MISVIIPTYNRAKYINRAIESVLNQTYKDFEIIVVDDNTEGTEARKNTEKTMKQYQNNSKVIYLKHKINKNGAAARNTGIAKAKGEYITFLDDDDYFLPERLENMKKALENNNEYNAVYSSMIVTKKGKIIGNIKAKDSGNLKKKLLLNEVSLGAGSNMLFRTKALKDIKGFDESFVRHQDIELMLRFLENNKILALDQYLVVLVQDDRSNELEPYKYLEVKQYYFKKFQKQINLLTDEEKMLFYRSNYNSILKAAINQKIDIKPFKELVEKYQPNKFKLNLKIKLYRFNRVVKISKIKYFMKKLETNFLLSKKEKEDIKKIERRYERGIDGEN